MPEVLLITQSDIIPGKEAEYRTYIQKTIPLMVKYGGGVAFVGSGIPGGTNEYGNNAVLTFPDQESRDQFLADPEYKALNAMQKNAVKNLHTAHFIPRGSQPEAVARQAFEQFRHGLATGEWQPFLDMLSDDFSFRFPRGEWKGEHHGKDKAAEFFAYVRQAYPDGLNVTAVQSVGVSDNTVLFEFQDEGQLRGDPYHGHVVVAFDVKADKIVAYREYFGA